MRSHPTGAPAPRRRAPPRAVAALLAAGALGAPVAAGARPTLSAPLRATPAVGAAVAATPASAVRLSPAGVTLPAPPGGADEAVRRFLDAAGAAVRAVYLTGASDPRPLAALAFALAENDDLARLRPVWFPILGTAAARADAQARLEPVMAALRRATRPGRAGGGARRPLSPGACREALGHPMARAPGAASMMVALPPGGARPLADWLAACREATATPSRALPRRPAGRPLPRTARGA